MNTYTQADMEKMRSEAFEAGRTSGWKEAFGDLLGAVAIIIIIGLLCIAIL